MSETTRYSAEDIRNALRTCGYAEDAIAFVIQRLSLSPEFETFILEDVRKAMRASGYAEDAIAEVITTLSSIPPTPPPTPRVEIQDTGTDLKFSDYDLSKIGNILTLGPVAREYSDIETLLIAVAFLKFMKTPQGEKHVKDIMVKYLDSTARIIEAMQKASCSNWVTALVNQTACMPIYGRLGLVTPFDQTRALLWFDHFFGEMEKLSVAFQGLGSLTTLIEGSKYSTGKAGVSGESLGTLATILKTIYKG